MAVTQLDLYRRGNKTHARFEPRLGNDVLVFANNGQDWVKAGTGGVSTYEGPDAIGTWWRLPQGATYDESILSLVNDMPTHWQWEPTRDMPLSDYLGALAAVGGNFIRV